MLVLGIGVGFYSGPPRFDGDRPRFGDREGYRAGPRGPPGEFGGEKGGALATSLLSGVLVEGLALAVDLEVMVQHHQVQASLRFMFC